MSDERATASEILAQADALMRRHRVFVAGGATTEQTTDDDIPVLTEIVSPEATSAAAVEADQAARRASLEARMREALLAWIDDTLPQEILKVTDRVADQLLSALDARMRDELLPQLTDALLAEDALSRRPAAPALTEPGD